MNPIKDYISVVNQYVSRDTSTIINESLIINEDSAIDYEKKYFELLNKLRFYCEELRDYSHDGDDTDECYSVEKGMRMAEEGLKAIIDRHSGE